MASKKEPVLRRVLQRGEETGLLLVTAALILVEAGYVAWLERLPALSAPAHRTGLIDLPPWYEHPRAEVTLLLTVLGGLIAWAAWGVIVLLRNKPDRTVASMHRATVSTRLKTAAFYAAVAGADILLIQFLRT